MQAHPQPVPQAPAGPAVPNLHDRLAFRLANANIANQCIQRTGLAASSTAALRAAVTANANPRPVLYEPTVLTGNITPGAVLAISMNVNADGQPDITRDGIATTDSLAVIEIGAHAASFTVIYHVIDNEALIPPAFARGSTYVFRPLPSLPHSPLSHIPLPVVHYFYCPAAPRRHCLPLLPPFDSAPAAAFPDPPTFCDSSGR